MSSFMSFQDHPPFVFDMATAAMAMGEVQLAARDGHQVPLGTGLGPEGELTTDPKEILKGYYSLLVDTKVLLFH